MTKSFCHFDTIPSDLMDIIEADLTEKFDPLMGTSKLMGNVTNTKKRNSYKKIRLIEFSKNLKISNLSRDQPSKSKF